MRIAKWHTPLILNGPAIRKRFVPVKYLRNPEIVTAVAVALFIHIWLWATLVFPDSWALNRKKLVFGSLANQPALKTYNFEFMKAGNSVGPDRCYSGSIGSNRVAVVLLSNSMHYWCLVTGPGTPIASVGLWAIVPRYRRYVGATSRITVATSHSSNRKWHSVEAK